MNIAFDLDKIFINYPPLIPAKLIDWLYRNHCSNQLSYRIPNRKLEQFVRQLTHFQSFRPAIKKNIEYINNFPRNPHHHNLYLISSRYNFLEKQTVKLLQKYRLDQLFTKVLLNTNNEQPHLFKENKIKNLKIDLYIDDDLDLLKYLKQHCPQTQLIWYNPKTTPLVLDGLRQIKNLEEVSQFLK